MGELGSAPETSQLLIVHLTDIHFGKHHRFNPGKAVGPGLLRKEGHPTLVDTLARDLSGPDPGCPIIICITGDFSETGSAEEFRQAESFIKTLAEIEIFGKPRGIGNIFVVPGNHDVMFSASEPEDRWTSWTNFYNQTFSKLIAPRDPKARFSFQDRTGDLGAIIVCLNSAEYVQKDTPEAERGTIDQSQLAELKAFLDRVPEVERHRAIRVALIHHHPVLIPGLAEPGKGYEAIENAGYLLNSLRKFGFHIILHGHKHTPYHFSEDSYTAFQESNHPPTLIVAGGSASSTVLPEGGQNCYNHLIIKWNPTAHQSRIVLWTRGLQTRHKGEQLLPTEWSWKARLIDDRQYIGGPRAPQSIAARHRDYTAELDHLDERDRKSRYSELRLNMPVCEVMPSVIDGQHYEARLWIEVHRPEYQSPNDIPTQVTWSAGSLNRVVTVRHEEDARYCATLHYYGPMLVQAKMEFPDGKISLGYIYARRLAAYGRPDRTIDIG